MNEEWVKFVKRSIICATTDIDVDGDLYTDYSAEGLLAQSCWGVVTSDPVRFLLLLGAILTEISDDGYEAVLDLATVTYMNARYGEAVVYFPEVRGERSDLRAEGSEPASFSEISGEARIGG